MDDAVCRRLKIGPWILRAAALASTASLGGCLGSDKEPIRTVSSTDQAAAVLVTPTMVAPWRDVAGALAPNFTMSGDAAASKVIPTTERVQTQVLSALGLSLAAGLPSTSTTSSETITRAIADKSVTGATGTTNTGSADNSSNSTSTTSSAPGVAPTAPSGTPAGGALPAGMSSSGDLGIDPVLQYKAANYLQQAVQLLNVEVQNAASRSCYIPYVAKLKLAVMPYRPDLGYDLHTRIAFFPNDADQTLAAKEASDCRSAGEIHVPVVVPLLAADDLQMAAKAKAIEQAQQIGLAVNAMIHGVGASASANKLNQRMQAILNRELSSSLTIARESDNTLYVRIAANNVASGQPSLAGQTYDVAVLLLVPRYYYQVSQPLRLSIDTYSEFRNATNGSILPSRADSNIVERIDRIMNLFLRLGFPYDFAAFQQLTPPQKIEVAGGLSHPIQVGDYAAFTKAMQCPAQDSCKSFNLQRLSDAGQGHTLWTALSTMLADTTIKATLLELPGPAAVHVDQQDAFVVDSGGDNATVTLPAVRGYQPGSLVARLRVSTQKPKKGPSRTFDIPATAASYDAVGQTLTLTFPSLKKLDIDAGDGDQTIQLSPSYCIPEHELCPTLNGSQNSLQLATHIATAKAASATAAAFNLVPLAQTIVIQKGGGGSASLRLSKLPANESAMVSVTGAEVDTVLDPGKTPVSATDDGYPLRSNGVYAFQFSNLTDGTTTSFSAQEIKGGKKLGTKSVTLQASKK